MMMMVVKMVGGRIGMGGIGRILHRGMLFE